jgi:hypothetical protein
MKSGISTRQKLVTVNRRLAKNRWGCLISKKHLFTLAELSKQFEFSLAMGDVLLIENGWYVTHTGLVRLAQRNRCAGIHVRPVPEFSDSAALRWAFEAIVYKSRACRGFVGYGDADPSNVSSVVRGAEMRVAETRAVNRALRKAYGVGICSVEEIGSFPASQPSEETKKRPPQHANGNYGGPKVRDQLCQIIRKHQLDATLVKSYATDFCGVKSLREAKREQVENFVRELAEWAEKDRNALLCQLNSYLPSKEKEGVA